jgi:hypothetical protein
MKIFKKLDEITVYLFYKIIETSDYSYLIKNRKKFKAEAESMQNELGRYFMDIIADYSVKTQNFKIFNDFKMQLYIKTIEFEYSLIKSILDLYEKNEDIEILYILDDIGFNFKECKNLESEIKKAISKCLSLKNKINISIIKQNQSNKKTDEKKEYNLDLIAFNLERALDLKYSINVKKTTMIRWINLINLSKKK